MLSSGVHAKQDNGRYPTMCSEASSLNTAVSPSLAILLGSPSRRGVLVYRLQPAAAAWAPGFHSPCVSHLRVGVQPPAQARVSTPERVHATQARTE